MGRNGFEFHEMAEVSADVEAVLEDARTQFGFVPNLLSLMAESPAALKGYRQLGELFRTSGLGKRERMLVELAASDENGCGYCTVAHSAQAAGAGVSAAEVDAVRAGGVPEDGAGAALVGMVRALIRRRGAVSDDEVAAFLAAGFSRGQLLDVVLGIAMKTISNYTNHLVDAPLDAALRRRGGESAH